MSVSLILQESIFFTLQLVIEKYLSGIGMNESIQIRSIKYAQNTTQCHTLCFLLSIRLPSGTNMYLIRLIIELLRERSMPQWKPPQTAKSVEGIYVLDGGLMNITFVCQSQINIHMFHIHEVFSSEQLSQICVLYLCYAMCLSICW